MNTSLVVGMGIGALYAKVLTNLGIQVVTVDKDPSKGATYTSVGEAIARHGRFLTSHICTPNYTHQSVAENLVDNTDIIFVEKPGFKTAEDWQSFVRAHPKIRIMMVKNNQWRDNFATFEEYYAQSYTVEFNWINYDRVPNPGSWFTEKALSWGGVSRDLMPHLLSIFSKLESKYDRHSDPLINEQHRWDLADLLRTDYGTVNPSGVYDVDDRYSIQFVTQNREIKFVADWRSLNNDDIGIRFHMDGDIKVVPLGLCPEEAYQNMIAAAIKNLRNDAFWANELAQDIWIHRMIQ